MESKKSWCEAIPKGEHSDLSEYFTGQEKVSIIPVLSYIFTF